MKGMVTFLKYTLGTLLGLWTMLAVTPAIAMLFTENLAEQVRLTATLQMYTATAGFLVGLGTTDRWGWKAVAGWLVAGLTLPVLVSYFAY